MKKFFLVFFLWGSGVFPQTTGDIIQPLTIFTNETKTVFLPDLFYSQNYNVKFLSNNSLKLNYNANKKELKISPTDGDSFTLLNFVSEDDTLAIPIIIRENYPVEFKFPSKRKYNYVTVFGSFNDWNRKKDTLNYANGYYQKTLYLREGNYQYKFFADGKEFCDPTNPDSVSNGMGGFNSLLVIEPKSKNKIFLHKLDFKQDDQNSVFSFYIDSKVRMLFSNRNVRALLDNKPVREKNIEVKNNRVFIRLTKEKLENAKALRVVAFAGKAISNIQNVFLSYGKPVSVKDNFDWRQSVIYSLMIDRFYDGDKSNSVPLKHDSLFAKANYMGGDFEGIIKKLDEGYFDSLGVNVLWISPVYDNPNKPYREYPPPHRWFAGYHGYWPVNSFDTDEHFGSLEQMKTLVKKAHAHGIKVLLDFVSNHVHIENPLFKEHRDWFGSLYLPDGRKNIRFWDEYRLTTWFEPYLPSFDYLGSREALDFMTDNALWWLKQTGADGFRHDAVKHVPNKFWRLLTRKLKERGYSNAFQIGETFGSDKLISSYVNNGQLNAQFNFNLYNASLETFIDSAKSFGNLMKELETSFSYYGVNNLMGNIMDSHDKNRFMAYADGDLTLEQWNATEIGWENPPKVNHPSSYKKAELYYAYMFAIPGIPVIYYGSEFGMSGASDPDNRRMMRFGSQLNKYEKQMLEQTSRIVKLRRNHSALNYGDFYPVKITKDVFAFIRSDFNERILIVLNKNFSEPENVELTLPKFLNINSAIDLQKNEKVSVKNHKFVFRIPPLGWKYFKLK